MLLFLRGLGGDLDEAVVRLIEDGSALLTHGEDALVFLALGDGVFERPQHGGIVDLARDGVGRERDGLFVVEGCLRDHVHKDERVVVHAEIVGQLVVQRGALVAFERGGVIARVVVIPCIARRSARADDQQRQQEGDEAAGDLQLLRRLIRQPHAVGQRGDNVQEQDEKQRLDREEHEVLADARQVKDRIGLAKDHLVIQQHDRRLDDDVHEEAHAEAGERHAKVRQRRTVQEQSKDQGTGDLREDEREEVHAGREQDTAKRITDGRRNDSNDRAEDHRAERIDEKAEVDHQRRGRNRNGDGLQRHADGDEDGRDGEHADLAELTDGVTPVGLGKRRGIQAGSERFLFSSHARSLLSGMTDGRPRAGRR